MGNNNLRISLLTVAIITVIGSALLASIMFTTTANATPDKTTTLDGMRAGGPFSMLRGFVASHFRHGFFDNQGLSGNVTITVEQAKTLVETSITSFKTGTPISFVKGWNVPVEDGKGVVISIPVGKISASNADQAKSIVDASLANGWKTGDPKLVRTIFSVPLIDSSGTVISNVNVNGVSGEIIRPQSKTLTVTSEQAKTIVSNAIKDLKIGDVKARGSIMAVGITYNDKVIMNIVLGKVNTPTSEAAIKTVQDSMANGWSAGEPKQLRFIYFVPINDANGNIIGNIGVDARTGTIAVGLPFHR